MTGGAGFLGSFVVRKLGEEGCAHIFAAGKEQFDLTKEASVVGLLNKCKPDLVIHLAAVVGGINANRKTPGKFFYENALMGIHLMEQARQAGVKKFVALGTVCCYPKFTPVPFKEKDLWNGYPEETNAPYALAKKMLLVQSQAYRSQYGFNSIFLMPTNIYGPGDHFDPETSHVIPALIKKCVEAVKNGSKEIVVWGTGRPSRDFLYVEDAAEAIVLAAKSYDKSDPVNIGTGHEIKICELVRMIAGLAGFKGKILWDRTRPDGQPRRMLDIKKAKREFGFVAGTRLAEGLKRTIQWYRSAA